MELKLVYRTLRKISDWTVTGYYSDCVVQGSENVPETGPLIMYVAAAVYPFYTTTLPYPRAPTHHNELVDIGALVMSLYPHRLYLLTQLLFCK